MLKKIAQTFFFRFSSAVLSFLIILITARLLGAEARGYISLLMVTITLLIMLNNFVGGPSLVYLAPRLAAIGLLKISYLWGAVICTLGTIVAYITALVPDWIIIHVFALSLLQSITTIHQFFLLGKKDIKTTNLIAFIQPLVQLLYIVFVYYLDKLTLIHIIYSMYISSIISVVISVYILRSYLWNIFSLPFFDIGVWREVFSYGFINQLANISQLISYRISYYFLNILAGTSALGIFSTGTSIAESVWLIGGSISLVQYVDIANTNNKQYAIDSTITLLKWSGITTLIALFFLNFIPSTFYIFIFGNEFSEIKDVLLWLSPGILAMGLGIIISHYFSGTGRYYINAITSGVGMFASLIFGYFFVNKYQLLGACMISSISYIITAVLLFVYFVRKEQAIEQNKKWFFSKRCR